MKNIFILIVLFFNTMLFSGTLKDFYLKNRVLDISAAPAFGVTEWESLLLLASFQISSAPDGAIFLSNSRDNKVIKFSAEGDLMVTFGRYGQGPGDLESPSDLSILNDKYLAVFNSDGDNRISLFDLNGKFQESHRFKARNFGSHALTNNKMIFKSIEMKRVNRNDRSLSDVTVSMMLKNLDNGDENLIESVNYRKRFLNSERVFIVPEYFAGQEVFGKTPQNNILAGMTTSDIIKILSPDGTLLKTYKLKMNPVPVSKQYIEKYKSRMLKTFREQLTDPESLKRYEKSINDADFSSFFLDNLPLYSAAFMDPEGNLLVFKWENTPDEHDEFFQIYTPDGALLSENRIKNGKIRFNVSTPRQNLAFSNKNLILLVEKETEDGDSYVQLIRIPTGAGPSR